MYLDQKISQLQSSELQISGMPDLRSVDWAQPQPCSNHGRGCDYMAKNKGCLGCHVSRQCKFRADGRPPSTSTNSGGRRDYLVTKGKPWTGFDKRPKGLIELAPEPKEPDW